MAFLGSLVELGALTSPDAEPTEVISRPTSLVRTEQESIDATFSDWLVAKAIPPRVIFELTYRCSEKCVHCFNPGASHAAGEKSERKRNELTTVEVMEALDQIADLGVYTVTFTGGEPSLRKDFFEIVAYARSLRLAVNIYTNGQMSADDLDRLCRLWPRCVSVSLYSAIPEIHDTTSRLPGSFKRSVETLRALNARGIQTSVKCPIMKHTAPGYKLLLDLCDELGAAPQFEFDVVAANDGKLSPLAHQIEDEITLRELTLDPRVAGNLTAQSPNLGMYQKEPNAPVCGAGTHLLSISPDGAVLPCNSLSYEVGSLRTNKVADIWRNSASLKAWQKIALKHYDECGTHRYCSFCSHCPGSSLSLTGNPLAPNPSHCNRAKVRMKIHDELATGQMPEQTPGFGESSVVHRPVPVFINSKPQAPRVSQPTAEKIETDLSSIIASGNNHRDGLTIEEGSPMHLSISGSQT